MKEKILQLGQIPFLFAIKELEAQEKYEQCDYAKKQLEEYCEYYRIRMWTIESCQVRNEEHMKLMTELAIIHIEANYKKD